ncbi:hypothetical protein VCR4J5_1260143 [Vibrio crassostreae]|uniref:Uncharacterized protein n=1 Tax=Vibrio crassostreae TaxID=246167 RepID=A0A822MXT9_9VIBR|nr:hypothetical protein VCRA2116O29_580011 [Vibrio crassostreae]CDT51923.1 hypothetical protein VCR26J2_180026 [Vibrio coralliirubri]CDS98262.1 hypothetical protein VCR4J5_1260143 [Vibrio crassostreae]CDT11612.1 hypothetical protein VCR19J5_1250143 [Vibrio crassostreae]CDT21194.1 hypothetical protein VCR5J5_180026 [Vibrio crassostreae]
MFQVKRYISTMLFSLIYLHRNEARQQALDSNALKQHVVANRRNKSTEEIK